MIALQSGDLIHVTNFEDHKSPLLRVGYRAPKGKVFVMLLLGIEDKNGPDVLDPVKRLEDLGYVPKQ